MIQIPQRARGQGGAAHSEAEAREQVDAAQAGGSRLGGTTTALFLFEGLVDEVASLVDGALSVSTNLAGVSTHDGAEDRQPGTPADERGRDHYEHAESRRHPCALKQRGNNAEGSAEGGPERDVQPRLEDLDGEVLTQHRHPVAHGGQHHHEDDGTQGGHSVFLSRGVEAHREPGSDRARPHNREGKRHETSNEPAERLNPLGAPQSEPDGQEEHHGR